MSTVNNKLTNLADEIRELSGTTEPLGLTEMATNVNEANDEVADQTDLIAQLASVLQGKSVPGGGEDVTAETATYTDLLTDLEAAVDSLPDAGGGGESSGYQVATGTLDVPSIVTAANGTAATVSGLGFKPKYICVITSVTKSITASSSAKNKYYHKASILYEDGTVLHMYVGCGTSYTSVYTTIGTNNSIYKIESIEDGFKLGRGSTSSSTITYAINPVSYQYIAIG